MPRQRSKVDPNAVSGLGSPFLVTFYRLTPATTSATTEQFAFTVPPDMESFHGHAVYIGGCSLNAIQAGTGTTTVTLLKNGSAAASGSFSAAANGTIDFRDQNGNGVPFAVGDRISIALQYSGTFTGITVVLSGQLSGEKS
jgi:hypothetical protein